MWAAHILCISASAVPLTLGGGPAAALLNKKNVFSLSPCIAASVSFFLLFSAFALSLLRVLPSAVPKMTSRGPSFLHARSQIRPV